VFSPGKDEQDSIVKFAGVTAAAGIFGTAAATKVYRPARPLDSSLYSQHGSAEREGPSSGVPKTEIATAGAARKPSGVAGVKTSAAASADFSGR